MKLLSKHMIRRIAYFTSCYEKKLVGDEGVEPFCTAKLCRELYKNSVWNIPHDRKTITTEQPMSTS